MKNSTTTTTITFFNYSGQWATAAKGTHSEIIKKMGINKRKSNGQEVELK